MMNWLHNLALTAGTLLGLWGPAQMSPLTRWGLLLLAVALSVWATYAMSGPS